MEVLYKKVNKSKDNLMGSVELGEGENPFKKPCLLCLSAQTGHDKSVFGASKVGAAMARCRVKGYYNGGYDIDGMPISFLASRMYEKEESAGAFVDSYLVPLLIAEGQKVGVEEACRRMRNVNILTYCDGILKALKIEEVLTNRLIKIGYSEEEVNKILGSIFVMAVATNRPVSRSKMSIAVFRDVLDEEVNSELDRSFVESEDQEMIVSSSPHCHYYYYKGDGDHDFKKYAFRDRVRALISLVLTSVLENSLRNAEGSYDALDLNNIFALVKDLVRQGLNDETILEMVDSRISYGGAPKMSREAACLRDELDEAYKKQYRTELDLKRLELSNKTQAKQLMDLQAAIKRNCTEANYYRILLEALKWQVSKEVLEMIMNTLPDKEIIEGQNPENKPKK